MSVHPLSVCVYRVGGKTGGLRVTLRYAYEVKPPSRKERISLTKTMLDEALARLEDGDLADVGFSEDAVRRVRTDQMEG